MKPVSTWKTKRIINMSVIWRGMYVSQYLSSRIVIVFLGMALLQSHTPASAYEALEWGQPALFADVASDTAIPHKLGAGIRSHHKKRRYSNRNLRVASLHTSPTIPGKSNFNTKSRNKRKRGRSRGVIWAANSRCLNKKLKFAIYHVARKWGRVRVNSTCRSRKHNRRVGGSKYSYHLTGKAADIRVWGNVRAAARYLRKVAGGYKHYGGGLFHIDIGPRRSW